ncbi:MAG: taurine catabolism dioxygenase TauD [Rhodospirillaceae bacterium]|jgi:hypothetical protein|nr:taurine catabolism dioxygenase TauD [Rhodospirillaceae bacterium]|tara:strand:+ start:8126 stop:9061 length:936 start_codon:yes stop_codon:yes gene_type:complete
MTPPSPANSPFLLEEEDSYRRWRDWKLSNQPASAGDLVVEIEDPLAPSAAEHDALLARLRVCNMAVYACRQPDPDPKAIIRTIAGRFGLKQLDAHLCAEEDGITPLSVAEGGGRQRYIPYTDRPINWHTDGYYNEPRHRVRALMLHCARPAADGGGNALMDPEIAYIRLRDLNPDSIAALQRPDAMTIPANEENGAEIRAARTGPVFFADAADGSLDMRYTARGISIEWADDPETRTAVEALSRIMEAGAPDVLSLRLAAGEGVLANNALHKRDGFTDAGKNQGRLVYRARFYDRAEGTSLSESYKEESNP